jgi:GT2 family glycosyltransferase
VTPVPDIAVVVPSHDRPLRLRWLLNALEEQTLPRERFEVLVAEDSEGEETARLLAEHPLTREGVLRRVPMERGSSPGVKRDAGWRSARAGLIALTDDDCRPPADWLERALEAAQRNPGAIVQGATRPDPDESELLYGSPHSHSQEIDPPTPWAETCNIVYPRHVLDAAGGFGDHPAVAAGEDTDLAVRARATGAPYVGAPEVVTYHAVEPLSLAARLRDASRWQHLPGLVKRHPQLRRELLLGVFWHRRHLGFALALAGLALARRRRWPALLVLPWAWMVSPSYGSHLRGRVRSISELPAEAMIDAAEITALARGSVRYRSPML